jgi:hypothetical protein
LLPTTAGAEAGLDVDLANVVVIGRKDYVLRSVHPKVGGKLKKKAAAICLTCCTSCPDNRVPAVSMSVCGLRSCQLVMGGRPLLILAFTNRSLPLLYSVCLPTVWHAVERDVGPR